MNGYNRHSNDEKAWHISQLIGHSLEGTLSEAGQQELDEWLAADPANQALLEELRNDAYRLAALRQYAAHDPETALPRIKSKLNTASRKPRLSIGYYAAAAVVLVALSIGLYFYSSKTSPVDIPPGYNQATLTLADGTKINLDSAQSGIIVSNEHIKYSNGGSVPGVILSGVRGNEGKGAEGSLPTSLSLTTPKGGQYQIILSDGTKVWLNAASTLKYPSRFDGDKRTVFLEGEAYFEVAKSEKHKAKSQEAGATFIVKGQNQEITVLGTSFNVSAYADETNERTTLIAGKVQVRSQNLQRKTYNVKLLSPQQQAVVKGDSLTVRKADVKAETAWRSNKFAFTGKTFKQVIDELARWYDLQVVYTNGIPDETFVGSAYRYENLSAVLRILKSYKVNYRIAAGRKLVIENLHPERNSP